MEPLGFDGVHRYSLHDRKSKVSRDYFGKVFSKGDSFKSFLNSIPDILAGKDLRQIVKSLTSARAQKKLILWGIGSHAIKVGLNPILIDLMKEGFVSGILLNGAGVIHDVELALSGKTSEEVSSALHDRNFGMAEETGKFVNHAAEKAYREKKGFGETLGRILVDTNPPYLSDSLLGQAFLLKIPVTVHVTIGADIVHIHPEASGEAIGFASFRDFQILCRLISALGEGSVLFNIGSAVVLPVVLEKAIAVCRNLGHPVEKFIGVNFDFLQHYRSSLYPVKRAKELGGEGYQIIGHHEILIPLLAAALKEEA
jgi:deoxyhypusine synthase